MPGQPVHSERDETDYRHALRRKVESGLAETKRDTRRNRFLAQSNGWSEAEYENWVLTGDPPDHAPKDRDTISPDEEERLHR